MQTICLMQISAFLSTKAAEIETLDNLKYFFFFAVMRIIDDVTSAILIVDQFCDSHLKYFGSSKNEGQQSLNQCIHIVLDIFSPLA